MPFLLLYVFTWPLFYGVMVKWMAGIFPNVLIWTLEKYSFEMTLSDLAK